MSQKDELFSKIITEFPQFQKSQTQYIDTGCDNDIVVIDQLIVFRFPKNKYVQSMMNREIRLLDICQNWIQSCTIPKAKYISQTNDFWGYEILPGILMNKRNGLNVLPKISTFLNELHTIPVNTLVSCNFEAVHYSITSGYLHHIAMEIEKSCIGFLSNQEIENAQKLILGYDGFVPDQTCLIHLDLTGNMIIDSTETKFTGVIDFSDAAIFDPAADFARFFDWGEDFATGVFSHYFADSESFRERAYFYYKRLLLTKLVKRDKDPKKLEKTKRILGL